MKKQEPVNCSDSELCTYLQALEAGFLPMFYSAISQYAPSRSMSIASRSYQRGRKTVSFHGFQSLMMSRNSTDDRGEELSMLSLEDSHAKTSASPGKAQESTESAADYGVKWRASLAKYDHDSRSWKTAQRSLIEDSDECSVIWPRSGMTVDGECWELPMLVRRTSESASGLWQTPNAMLATSDVNFQCSGDGRTKPNKLGWAVAERWPTPTVCGNYNSKGASATSGDGLATAVSKCIYPTATATAYKGWSPNHNRTDTNDRLDYTIEREAFIHGQQTPPMRLNPDWVEWLMGWPLGWTDLKPLAMDKCHCAPQQRGAC